MLSQEQRQRNGMMDIYNAPHLLSVADFAKMAGNAPGLSDGGLAMAARGQAMAALSVIGPMHQPGNGHRRV
ncbi:hypothetical protein FZ025_00210 [Xanthomonas hyacinthi]|nr:hypothetical protein [Xanthomonas hyacinthi]QGY75174.1 hypothetical protein FZ025_00210 [Xanthomonas hyacinthi]